jgi:hypothetical protein
MAINSNKPITSVAEWKATFLPNSVAEVAEDETPNLMWMARAAAMEAVHEVSGKPAQRRQQAARTTRR